MANRVRRQIQAVLSTYAVWWLTWLIFAVYLIGLIFVITINRQSPTSLSSSITVDASGQTWDQLPADLTTVDHIVFNPEQLTAALQPGSPLRIPGQLPKLERIAVFQSISEQQMIELLEFRRLRSLLLIELPPLTDRGWAALERQPLEELKIYSMDRQAWVTGRWPKTVRTLLVQDDQPPIHDPERSHLEPLVWLPRLRTLEVRLLADKRGHLRDADRKALLEMTALGSLYVQAPESSIVEFQRDLPQIAVRPNSHDSRRVIQAVWISALSFLPLILILHVASMQFVTSASLLMPNSTRRHWQTTMGLLCCWALIQSCSQFVAGGSLLFAVSTSGILLIPTFVMTMFLERTSRFPGFTHFAFMVAAGPLTLPVVAVVLVFSAESDWMIQGHRPDIASALVVLTIASTVGFQRFFHRLSRRIMEAAEGTIPFGIWATKSFERWSIEGSSEQKWQNRVWGNGQVRRFTVVRKCERAAANYQSLLWRASQPMTALGLGCFLAFPMTLAGCMVVGFGPRHRSWLLFSPICLQVSLFLWCIPAIRLASQRPFLARLYLSACDRPTWVRMIFRETARDFLPAVIFAAFAIIVYERIGPTSQFPTIQFAVLVAGLMLSTYGFSLLIETYPPSRQIVLTLIGLIVEVMLMSLCVINLAWPPQSGSFPYRLVMPIGYLTIFAVAAVTIRAAYRRWLTRELA